MADIDLQIIKDLFPELARSNELIREIASVSMMAKFSRGDVIMDYGDYIEFVPMLISGLMKIIREGEDGQEVLLYFLGSGESCAASFSCCMIRKRSEIKAVCEEDATILMIPLKSADEWMGKYNAWRDFIFGMYDARLFALIDTIDRVSFANLDEKLLYYLDEMQRHKNQNVFNVSHSEIAHDLNASRESVSRLLKKLENQGKVKLGRNEIVLLET